ncbi:MAG: DUF1786 domain-containing protein [Chloroflexi bacterium]|nr:DUF1786 domain-containing protein [Chloroflexota bacterium]
MQILSVDVGTGTQDILLFDSERTIENCFKLVMPSPTAVVAQRIRQATARGLPVLLTGVTMGGGPCVWAAQDHLKAGFAVYATPDAARTFDDDLAVVERLGVVVVSEDEAKRLEGALVIPLRDFDARAITEALKQFDVPFEPDVFAIAVFDHGAAPTGVSDRRFRFEYLADVVAKGEGLAAFAYARDQIPSRFTRMLAVEKTVDPSAKLFLMDTGPAAALGALEDPVVACQPQALIVNIGNFHTLAFRFDDGQITGIFEHHTGELSPSELEGYLRKLAQGTITNEEVFADQGHGAVLSDHQPWEEPFIAVTGPRRGMLRDCSLPCYYAVPHGDMMLAGCFGLLRAVSQREATLGKVIQSVIGSSPFA